MLVQVATKLDPETREQFKKYCAQKASTPSQMLRYLVEQQLGKSAA